MRRARWNVERLEDRKVPAVFVEVGFGTLTVFGDAADNEIIVSRDELGIISVNGEVPLAGGLLGGFPTVFNTREITVFGASGDDVLRLDEANGPLPSATLYGASGGRPPHRREQRRLAVRPERERHGHRGRRR